MLFLALLCTVMMSIVMLAVLLLSIGIKPTKKKKKQHKLEIKMCQYAECCPLAFLITRIMWSSLLMKTSLHILSET
jgi:hypothetical protein